MSTNYLRGSTDGFIGRRTSFQRYLVCALEGYFPVLVRTGENSLAVIFRSGATHVGISGTLSTSISENGGISWSDPIAVTPRWNDDRNPALGVNRRGELIAAFWRAGAQAYPMAEDGSGRHYQPAKGKELEVAATYITRSGDAGAHWSTPQLYRSELINLASPYGRIVAEADGTLLMNLYGSLRGAPDGSPDITVLCRSRDDGQTWGDESVIAEGYNETALLPLADGTLLAACRSTSGLIALTRSNDGGGRSWTEPKAVTRIGEHPADLTLLQSGRVLLSYGRRIRPYGAGLLYLGKTGTGADYSREVLLAGDGILNQDLGYPSTVQLADGHIVTVLYYACGSAMSQHFGGWGDVSCQAIHYHEADLAL
ncbi:MAG: exo-alpha-sialidase [Chloroflexi bacterium]|nr:exo-alpha-sialidase [Chloroflexota bacterium]